MPARAVVLSGNAYAKAFKQQADARLAAAVAPASRSRMLKAVRELEVVEHGRSQNYCAHLRRNASQCAEERTVGLLAQQVAKVEPRAVSAGMSLELVEPRASLLPPAGVRKAGARKEKNPVKLLEKVKGVQSIDLHVIVAQLVGAVQAQAEQIDELQKTVKAQAELLAARN